MKLPDHVAKILGTTAASSRSFKGGKAKQRELQRNRANRRISAPENASEPDGNSKPATKKAKPKPASKKSKASTNATTKKKSKTQATTKARKKTIKKTDTGSAIDKKKPARRKKK